MRRILFFASAALLFAIPFAGSAIAQQPSKTIQGKIRANVPMENGCVITLKSQGEVTATVHLPRESKRTLKVVRAKEVTQTYGETPSTLFKGNVDLQVMAEGKKLMEFHADEAMVVIDKVGVRR